MEEEDVKWNTLQHKGPVFTPPYEPLPKNVHFIYDGEHMELSLLAEEAATYYGRLLNHKFAEMKEFKDNFFEDWKKLMTMEEKQKITDLSKCNFRNIFDFFEKSKKCRTKEEQLAKKNAKKALKEEFGFCAIDGKKEEIDNFRVEPPGLFISMGEHPKMGMIKSRIAPEDVTINCGKNSDIPKPPEGHEWKEVRHDNTVTWLASWKDNIQDQTKYIKLSRSSTLKGEADLFKYDTARKLHEKIEEVRENYRMEWNSKEMKVRQRAVAMYLIDTLALRPGNKKDEDQADTVGCCSLKVKDIRLLEILGNKKNVVILDFIGKASIPYYKELEVEEIVFENLGLFMDKKEEDDDLFNELNTTILNDHLKSLMEGLTAKVFRTYNASITFQRMLDELTDKNANVKVKLKTYNEAIKEIAKLCNHTSAETSKMNYLDPRITIAWCKKYDVPIEDIFSDTQIATLSWSINTTADYRF